jgi:MoxR-like ATPase
MSSNQRPKYKGDTSHLPPMDGMPDLVGNIYYPYLPSPDLVKAVNLAIALERPLLLEGEPGCGKTCLAGAIAYEFTQQNFKEQKDEKGQPKWWPFYTWTIKSTSRARDGLYTFDAVARLRDAQLIASVGGDFERLKACYDEKEIEQLEVQLKDPKRRGYREFGRLGTALMSEMPKDQEWKLDYPPVVLIDEIDKADSDFANDLLLEIEEWRFEIPETGEKIGPPKHKPIVLITSNREKPLPEPFLRRCLYFFVPFPEERLREIIERRFGSLTQEKQEVVNLAIQRFSEIQALLENQPGERSPGVSEFLLFLAALLDYPTVENAINDLQQLADQLPLLGILLKNRDVQDLYRREFPVDDE